MAKPRSEDKIKFHYKSSNGVHSKISPKLPPSVNFNTDSRRKLNQGPDYLYIKAASSNILKTLNNLTSVVEEHTIENVSIYILLVVY